MNNELIIKTKILTIQELKNAGMFQGKNCIPREDCKILGRPITALDVCWALQEKYEGKKEFAVMTNCLTEMSIQTHRGLPNKDTVWFQYAVKVIAKFNTINTTLKDWNNEICENIVKLIDL